jgi:predicted HicB family RNase H-like nuclease
MIRIETEMNDGAFSGVIFGEEVTYTCNWPYDEVDNKTFEISEDTFHEKCGLIKQGLPFEFEEMELELPDHLWLELAMGAHKKDMTLNKYIEYILRLAIDNQ